MANIDLRPWREERRKVRQNQFIYILVTVVLLAAAVGWFWNFSVKNDISFQNNRNAYLEGKIKELDVKIKEIKSLRQQREDLIDRMEIIQSLQGDRPIIIHVFEELVRSAPDGVFFTKLESKGKLILISAQADKTISISDFLRNLDASLWFDDAFMEGMESIKDGQDVIGHKFKLRVSQVDPLKEGEQ